MKKLLLLLLVLIAGAASAYLFFPQEVREWTQGTPLQTPPPSTTVYKWQDKDGNPMISDQPPTDGTPYETATYRHDLNIAPLPEKLKNQQ